MLCWVDYQMYMGPISRRTQTHTRTYIHLLRSRFPQTSLSLHSQRTNLPTNQSCLTQPIVVLFHSIPNTYLSISVFRFLTLFFFLHSFFDLCILNYYRLENLATHTARTRTTKIEKREKIHTNIFFYLEKRKKIRLAKSREREKIKGINTPTDNCKM